MTPKIAAQPRETPLQLAPKMAHENDEILGELYAVKAQLNREANYDVSVLLKEARADVNRVSH
jgi:hypothetical protein